MKIFWLCVVILTYALFTTFVFVKYRKNKKVPLSLFVSTITIVTVLCGSYLVLTYFEDTQNIHTPSPTYVQNSYTPFDDTPDNYKAPAPDEPVISQKDSPQNAVLLDITDNENQKESRRYKFPLENRNFDFLSEVKGALPLAKNLHKTNTFNFSPSEQVELKRNIEVQEDFWVKEESDICKGEKIVINISSCGALISADNEEKTVLHLLEPFILYRTRDEKIILEGSTKTRLFYRYTFEGQFVTIEEGPNVDLPADEKYDIAGYVNYSGTYTFKDGILTYWQFGEQLASLKIPEPKVLSEKLCDNTASPYISKNGEMVLLSSCVNEEGELKLKYTILTENVDKILEYNKYLFSSKDGKYGYVNILTQGPIGLKGTDFNYDFENYFDEPIQTEVVWLSEENVSMLKFKPAIATDSKTKEIKLLCCDITFMLKDSKEFFPAYILAYEPDCDTFISEETLKEIEQPFTPDKYEEKLKWLEEVCS